MSHVEGINTMRETAQEYIDRVMTRSKDFYKTPEAMMDEMIGLMSNLRNTSSKDEERRWELAVAVSEAWHTILWSQKHDRADRLVNSIMSFIEVYDPLLRNKS